MPILVSAAMAGDARKDYKSEARVLSSLNTKDGQRNRKAPSMGPIQRDCECTRSMHPYESLKSNPDDGKPFYAH